MVRRVTCLAMVGGVLVAACGNADKGDDSPSGGSAGTPAAGAGGSGGVPTGGGSGGSAGAAMGGKSGSASGGSAGGSGSAGAPDVGTFTGLTGMQHLIGMNSDGACVADSAGVVTCDSSFNRPPTTPFASLAVGTDISGRSGCGLTAMGEVSCWGGDVGTPAPGPYTAIAAGDGNACGIRPNGSITCFGSDTALNQPPTGTFTDVSVDDQYACALAVDGHVECWGTRASSKRVDGTFKQVVVGSATRCTLDMAGAVSCLPDVRGTMPAGPFERISSSSSHVCGLRSDGSVACWGTDSVSRLAPPAGPFTDVASYFTGVCARKMDGTAACWGPGYGDGGSTLACKSSQTKLMGSLDGATFSLDANAGLQTTFDDPPGTHWTYTTYSSTDELSGLIVLDGAEDLTGGPEYALMDGQSVAIDRVLLQTGATDASAGDFFCSASGSTGKLNVEELTVTLSNLHALGGCPGTPVDGELTVASNLKGTADGHTFDLTMDQGSNIGAAAGLTTLYLDDASYVAVQKADDGTVPWAIVVTAPSGDAAGAVYCAGAGSTWVVSGSKTESTLKGLSKLDACPTGTSADSLTGCIR